VPATVGDGVVLIPGGLQVTISPEQEPQAWADPVDGVILDLDDDLRVFATMEQAMHLHDAIGKMLANMLTGDPPDDPNDDDDPDDIDPTVNELLDRGEL